MNYTAYTDRCEIAVVRLTFGMQKSHRAYVVRSTYGFLSLYRRCLTDCLGWLRRNFVHGSNARCLAVPLSMQTFW